MGRNTGGKAFPRAKSHSNVDVQWLRLWYHFAHISEPHSRSVLNQASVLSDIELIPQEAKEKVYSKHTHSHTPLMVPAPPTPCKSHTG